jgi:hypothetical protein
MADFAAHLVDRVLPFVPVRQWVLSLPIPMRLALAFDRELCRRARSIFVRAIQGSLERRAMRAGIPYPETGAVTVVQRFGSALNLNLHFHSLVLDGVLASRTATGALEFFDLGPPPPEELARILARVRARILLMLRRQGVLTPESRLDESFLPADSTTLAACAAASSQRRIALGPECGQPLARRRDPALALPYRFVDDTCVDAQGFSLHAGVSIPAHDRHALERLCRYLLRPPVSDDRLTLTDDGRIALELKTPYDDGTTHFLFKPAEFLARLAALVPPPRAHTVVYHGILAPNATRRAEIVPGHQPSQPDRSADRPQVRPRNYTWAELMKRVLALDVLQCPCGGRRSLIAVITQMSVIRAILLSLGLNPDPPVCGSARGPPATDCNVTARSDAEPSVGGEPQGHSEIRFDPDAG